MSIYRTHILLPVDEGTVQAGVFEVKRRLEKELQARRAWTEEVKVLETGTVGIVGKGVILVVYPGPHLLFQRPRRTMSPRIVDEHLLKGRVVAAA
ncbi:MAG: hypothetical protein MZW92_16930 [Comamonadaceae bacterium]|nr:hypothetical protein [Comamonadaceae bacterium]